MKIALYGYGKMGRAIEQVALSRGHSIGLKVNSANAGASPSGHDVAIEFSKPDQALANMKRCLEAGVPVAVGTTGWYDQLSEVKAMVQANRGSLLWASNFSIGVNILFKLNKYLAAIMNGHGEYDLRIDEVHHIHKLDKPSGTAITLARDIDLKNQRYAGWVLKEPDQAQGQAQEQEPPVPAPGPGPIIITSDRTGEVPGKHSVVWTGPDDRLILTHDAFSRKGFATGAVVAAEWLAGRTGLFTMEDVLEAGI